MHAGKVLLGDPIDCVTQPDRHLPGMSQIGGSTGYLNGGHIFELNALRTKSLSEGMMLGRRLARRGRVQEAAARGGMPSAKERSAGPI